MKNAYSLSADEAIQKGKWQLAIIPGIIRLIAVAASFTYYYLAFWRPAQQGHLFVFGKLFQCMAISVVGLLIGFGWRSLHSASWKIWALQNVKDVQWLYQAALRKGMINQRGSWLDNFEYKTATQKQALAELEKRLDEPRELDEAFTKLLPEKRIFRYSVKVFLAYVGVFIAFLAIGKFIVPELWLFEIFIFGNIFGIIMAITWMPRLTKPVPLQLTSDGILMEDVPFIPWSEVKNIYVEKRAQGKGATSVLVIDVGTFLPLAELYIEDVECSNDEIERAVYDFWVRWKNQQNLSVQAGS